MGLLSKIIGKKNLKNRFNPNLAKDLSDKSRKETASMKPLNIVVVGKTGSGKSTLINALFREKLADTGVGKPVTQDIQRITKDNVPVVLYDSQGLELTSESQQKFLTSLAQLIKEQKAKGPREAIDLVYYCINSQTNRIEDYEIDLIQALSKSLPVVLIMTQTLGEENRDFESYLRNLDLPVKAIVPILAKPYLLQDQHYIPSFGMQDLIDASLKVLPEEAQGAFINAQQIDLDLKVQRARRWAKRYISTAFGVGFVPIPVADSAILVPMQVGMLAHITSIFGLSLDKSQIISILAGIGGTGSATLLGKYLVSSATKLIPGLGTVTGGAISGATASLLTVGLAYAYIEVLHQVALAEISGRDMPLKEMQRLMNAGMKDQFAAMSEILPDNMKDGFISDWLEELLK